MGGRENRRWGRVIKREREREEMSDNEREKKRGRKYNRVIIRVIPDFYPTGWAKIRYYPNFFRVIFYSEIVFRICMPSNKY